MLSTVLAGLGQIISLQNIGSFATYSAHDTVATYAIAALLVGGATVKQAKVHNVFLGLLLFHALFIVAPQAGNQIFGNPVYGEYFRVFVSYGVIAMALILNAWDRPESSASRGCASQQESERYCMEYVIQGRSPRKLYDFFEQYFCYFTRQQE